MSSAGTGFGLGISAAILSPQRQIGLRFSAAKPAGQKWLFAVAAVLLIALVTTLTTTVWAQTGGDEPGPGGGTGPGPGGPALHFADESGGSLSSLSLPALGASSTFFIEASGLETGVMNTVQVLVSHDPAVTEISTASCTGIYAGAVGDGPTEVQSGQTGFLCGLANGPLDAEGRVMEITVTRTGYGEDQLAFVSDGDFGTRLYAGPVSGNEGIPATLGGAVEISLLAGPTATVSPTPTSPPSGGGGPGPQPTATPAYAPPGAPVNVTAQPLDGAALISWNPPASDGGAGILSYTVNIVGGTQTRTVSSPGRSLTFTGLENGVEYRFRVRATNGIGDGPYSAATGPVTPAGATSAPLNVTANALAGGASAEVSWDPPADLNGAPVLSYTVTEVTGKVAPVTMDAPATSHVFNELAAGDYSFTVTATNRAGESAPSSPSPAITLVPGGESTPTPTPAPEPTVSPDQQFSAEESALLAEQLSAALGTTVRVTAGKLTVAPDPRGVKVIFPAVAEGAQGPAGEFAGFRGGGLDITAESGKPDRLALELSDALSLSGGVSFEVNDGTVEGILTGSELTFAPAVPDLGGLGGSTSLLTQAAVSFQAMLLAVDGAPELSAQFAASFGAPLTPSFEEVQAALTGQGWSIPANGENVALVVDVTAFGITNDQLGATTAAFSASSGWVQSHQLAGDTMLIIKIDEAGEFHVRSADCSEASISMHRCEAVFDEDAAGFSIYALVAAVHAPEVTPLPTATPTAENPDASGGTPLPGGSTPAPGAQPSPTAGADGTVTPDVTPTPPLTFGDPGGSSAIAIVGIAVGFGAAGLLLVGYFVNRHRNGVASFIIAASLAGSGALLLAGDENAQAYSHNGTQQRGLHESPPPGRVMFDTTLSALRHSYQASATAPYENAAQLYAADQLATSAVPPLSTTGDRVPIEVISMQPEQVESDLQKLGATDIERVGRVISGWVNATLLPRLDEISVAAFAYMPYGETHGLTAAGEAESQGDAAMQSDRVREEFGVDGEGITVGVISDSFDCDGRAQDDIDSGELPADVEVLKEGPCHLSDEGRAMMQIIHDVAPGAALLFHTGFPSMAVMAEGVRDLADAGADIIVDDIGYYNSPFFQDGILAQAVSDTVDRGVIYFSAAGNSGRNSYESEFRPGPPEDEFPSDCHIGQRETCFLGGTPHDFDPGPGQDYFLDIVIPRGKSVLSVQWEQPAASAGGTSNESEVDMYVFAEDEETVLASLISHNIGFDPVELISFDRHFSTPAKLMVLHRSGTAPGTVKIIGSNGFEFGDLGTDSSTIFGHQNVEGVITVGAVDYHDTPAFEDNPLEPQHFSAAGGTQIFFSAAGNRLSDPLMPDKPDVMAPDNTNTSFFNSFDPESDGFPNFRGTSASAPHVAGVAALLLELKAQLHEDGKLGPREISEVLRRTALDMGDDGFDFDSGYGLVDALAAAELLDSAEAPVAQDDAFTISVNSTLETSAPAVLENDSDANDDDIVAELVQGVSHGVLTLEADGKVAYTPNDDFTGVDSFTYIAYDGLLTSGTRTPAKVTITVEGVESVVASVALQGVQGDASFGADTPALTLQSGQGPGAVTPFEPGQNGPVTLEKVGPGDYTLTASAPGFLPASHNGITVSDVPGTVVEVDPHVELLMGDSNGDQRIDGDDAGMVAAAFGTAPGADETRRDEASNVVDLNGDGVVNGYDLSMVLSNLGAEGPMDW